MNQVHRGTSMAAACGFLAWAAVLSAQQAATTMVQPVPVRSRLTVQGFSVALVLGDIQGGAIAENVPATARKALADMKDFLPYRSYRLLDTAWLLGANAASRVRGPDDAEYEVVVGAGGVTGAGTVHVSFHLREPGAGEAATAVSDAAAAARADRAQVLSQKRVRLETELASLRRDRSADTHQTAAALNRELEVVKKQIAELDRTQIKRPASILSSQFDMEPGETVVVGTSKLRGGDKALIALLTAVPRAK